MKTLSVLVPIFNGREVVSQSIANILMQTARPHEIVLADDGSTDGLREIVPDLSARCAAAAVRLTSVGFERNRGRGAARNLALRAAGGELVAWFDADDLWAPEKLAFQMEAFARLEARHPPDRLILTCNYNRYGSQRRLSAHPFAVQPTIAIDDLVAVWHRRHIQLQTTLGPRAAFLGAGLFDETLDRAEDFDFSVRFAATGGKFVNPDVDAKPMVHYFRSPLNRGREALEQNRRVVDKLSRIFAVASIDPEAFLQAKHGSISEDADEPEEGEAIRPASLAIIADGVARTNGEHPIRLALAPDGALLADMPSGSSGMTLVVDDGLHKTVTRWSEPAADRHLVGQTRLVELFLAGARWLTLYIVQEERMISRALRFRRAASGLITLGIPD